MCQAARRSPILMALIRQQPYNYNERGQSMFMKKSRGNARPRASIPSPLSTYSISTNSPPELAAYMGPRALPTATMHHGPKMLWQSPQPQSGQLRIVNQIRELWLVTIVLVIFHTVTKVLSATLTTSVTILVETLT